MSSNQRSDQCQAASNAAGNAAHDAALLDAATRMGRLVAGGVAHDLNSALQGLGDALYSIGEDTADLESGQPLDDARLQHLQRALKVADASYTKLARTARAVPNLVPALGQGVRPIDLHVELLDLVALTTHNWRHRLDVSVAVDPQTRAFSCAWWIARLAVLRMVLIAVEAHPSRRAIDQPLPQIQITGRETDGVVELSVAYTRAPTDADSARDVMFDALRSDDTVLLCASKLDGEVRVGKRCVCSVEVSFHFPVRVVATLLDAVSFV